MIDQTTFAHLVPGDDVNVRGAADRKAGLDELAASIKAKGLLNPLTVRRAGKKTFQVIAGNRRLAAIGKLIKAGDWKASDPIAITVRDEDDAAARETSLMENVARLPMHPVDQYEAFHALSVDGMSPEDIATRFGIGVRTVRQQLALGGLAPAIRKAWRDGEIKADAAQAFTFCKNLKLQAQTFEKLRKSRDLYAHNIRKSFVSATMRTDAAEVQVVGLERYRAAGGKVTESLFEDHSYIEDPELMKQLANEALQAKCAELIAAGWSFAMTDDEAGPGVAWQWQRLRREPKFTKEQSARLKAIEKECEKLEDSDDWPASQDRMHELGLEQQRIERDAAGTGWSAEDMKKSGCIIGMDECGIEITHGLIRPKAKKAGQDKTAPAAAGEPGEDGDTGGLSSALMETITTAQTIAAQEALQQADPHTVMCLAIAGMQAGHGGTAVRLHLSGYKHDKIRTLAAPEDNFQLLLQTPSAAVQRLFVQCLAHALDLRSYNAQATRTHVAPVIDALPGYGAAMQSLFDPEDFFARSPARVAIDAMVEMVGRNPCISKKKADIAGLAASYAKRHGWLPAPLRHAAYKLATGESETAPSAAVAPAKKPAKAGKGKAGRKAA